MILYTHSEAMSKILQKMKEDFSKNIHIQNKNMNQPEPSQFYKETLAHKVNPAITSVANQIKNDMHDAQLHHASQAFISQTNEIAALQKQLDHLTTLKWDHEEEISKLTSQVFHLQFHLDSEKATKLSISNETEKHHQNTLKDLDICRSNLKYSTEHIKELDETIRLAKLEMDKLRSSKVSDEHLARKLLELVEENNKLKESNIELLQINKELLANSNQPIPDEIKKYQEQVTRLLAEKVINEDKIRFLQQSVVPTNISSISASDVDKIREERDFAVRSYHCLTETFNENRKLISQLSHEDNNLKSINHILIEGLHKEKSCHSWEGLQIVNNILQEVINYRKNHGMPPNGELVKDEVHIK